MAKIEIEFLTDSGDLRELCRQYWQIDTHRKFVHKVIELSEVFKIPRTKLASTVAASCIASSRDEACSSCGTPRPFKSRADFQQRRSWGNWGSWTCDDCQEAQRAAAREETEQRDQRRRDLIQHELDASKDPGLSGERLSLVDVVYLVSLLRAGGSEDLAFILPHESFSLLLSPTPELDREILDHLYRRSIICIHPDSREESIVIEDGEFIRFVPSKVHWILPLLPEGPSAGRLLEDLEDLLKSDEWPEGWLAKSEEIHRKVALHECLQYLRVVIEDHGFEFRAGAMTCHVLKSVLKTFSVGQAYNFIWRAARDAAAFYVRETTSKAHAANIVPGSIQRMAERALAEAWDVKAYRRDFRAPESVLSQVLFTLALQLPEGGFNTIPPPEDSNNSEDRI
ncbi:MAG: hypothetical protein KAW17_02130 [Candidatus Eisenbacteria sp.]|nr:hypothetical protein [Candidatus Eisenbacteria bacterium]